MCGYEMPSRRIITGRIHELDEKERTAKATPAVATGHHSVTIITSELQCIMLTRSGRCTHIHERHYAETCAGHFTKIAQQWNLSNKVITLSTKYDRCCKTTAFQSCLQRSVTASLHDSVFDNVLIKCKKSCGAL